jgi:hypothetical protein
MLAAYRQRVPWLALYCHCTHMQTSAEARALRPAALPARLPTATAGPLADSPLLGGWPGGWCRAGSQGVHDPPRR